MEQLYLENINKARIDYPYINLVNLNMNYSVHYHSEIEIIYVVNGKISVTINSVDNTLQQGDICIIMPGEIHSLASNISSHIYIMKFFSSGEFNFMRIQNILSPTNANYAIFKKIIDNIATEDTERSIGYKNAINMYSNELILQILRTLKPQKMSDEIKRTEIKHLNFLNEVNEYLEENYTEKISLSDISSYFGYSKFYFSHLFKEITLQSFIDFLIAFRMEKAVTMLMNGQNITKIALECGFGSSRNFNRHFKNLYNTTPTTLKNKSNKIT